MSTKQIHKSISNIYSYDKQIERIFQKIRRDLPTNTIHLIQKYDREMINSSMAKGTRRKHLQTLLVLSRMLDKEWHKVTKEDIDILVSKIMAKFKKRRKFLY